MLQRSWVRIPLNHLNFSGSWDNCLNCPASARIISSFDFKHRTSYNISFISNFYVWTFRRHFRPFYDVEWPVLQLRGRHEHMMTNVQFVSFSLTSWFQFNSRIFRTGFTSVMTLNNWEMIAETRRYIFRWRSRCRRLRLCSSSLLGFLRNDDVQGNDNATNWWFDWLNEAEK